MATGKLPRTRETKITYSVAGGFSENILVMPNGSEIAFKFYEMKVGNLPGPELDGVWADELIPYDWIETLQYRLVNRNGILHITFTPELGWTETVAHYLEGATILEEVEAELLPLFGPDGRKVGCKKVPRVVQCRDPRARIIYFHTHDNPYGNYEGLQKLLEGKSEGEIALRAYGVVEKGHYAAFPLFNEKAHVISVNQWEALQRQFPRLQRYMLVDPCSGRNWFMIWVACPAADRWIIYREWPSHGHLGAYVDGFGDPGSWTVMSRNPDGAPGPAQKTFGFGLARYIDEILRIENGEEIVERWIDSRYATARVLDREATTTLIEQLDELGMFFRASTPERNILGAKDGSIDMINSALYYDLKTPLGQFSAELGRLNAPKLQVVETCPNTIYSLKTWTGKDGGRGSSKDPIDTIRMLFLSEVGYLPESAYTWTRY